MSPKSNCCIYVSSTLSRGQQFDPLPDKYREMDYCHPLNPESRKLFFNSFSVYMCWVSNKVPFTSVPEVYPIYLADDNDLGMQSGILPVRSRYKYPALLVEFNLLGS